MANKETAEQKQQREMVEGIAENLTDLANSVKALLTGKLNRKAIVILLAQASGENQSTVNRILDAVSNLERDWVRK